MLEWRSCVDVRTFTFIEIKKTFLNKADTKRTLVYDKAKEY